MIPSSIKGNNEQVGQSDRTTAFGRLYCILSHRGEILVCHQIAERRWSYRGQVRLSV